MHNSRSRAVEDYNSQIASLRSRKSPSEFQEEQKKEEELISAEEVATWGFDLISEESDPSTSYSVSGFLKAFLHNMTISSFKHQGPYQDLKSLHQSLVSTESSSITLRSNPEEKTKSPQETQTRI